MSAAVLGAEKEHLPSNPRQLGPTSGLRAVKFKLLLALHLVLMVSNLTSLVYWIVFAWTSNVLASVPMRARAAFGVVRCSPGEAWTAQSSVQATEGVERRRWVSVQHET